MVDGALINGQATTPKAGMHEYAYKHAMVCQTGQLVISSRLL
jgi:hypothetical protein